MGGISSSGTSTIIGKKGSILVTFYDMDKPENQSHQAMRITEETTINNIIQYIKEKQDCQNVSLYYDQIPIDDLSFQLYEYLDLLPSRKFGYRINQMQQQNTKQSQGDKQQTSINNQQQQSKITMTNQKLHHGEVNGQDIPPYKTQFKTPINNNSDFNQPKQGTLKVISSQTDKGHIIEDQNINQGNNYKSEKTNVLNIFLKYTLQKYQEAKQQSIQQQRDMENNFQQLRSINNKLESEKQNMSNYIEDLKCKIESMQNGYNKIKQENEELQHRNKILQSELQNFSKKNDLPNTTIQSNLSTDRSAIINESQIIETQQVFKNKCGHHLEEQKIQNILKQSLSNKTIAHCYQCKPSKISGQILIKMEPLGQAYKEFQANEELNQLLINLKSQKKTIYKCSRNTCNFFCIFNKSSQISSENSFCPSCLLKGMKISD
ncbi:unnamed protein product (macronuclear) [Paramecium tetraurelia]|uniref:Uncharacterized protein n=1 Tax=Paramecium tetraurelia TaxID=5888 RepID=A0BU60_PARTE|nr:uncharacterized protein GSPATT00032309001 [Paramecium tetraurelia]CAK62077.1 unnamed protein product [Paramecium tetraurelia]|eukprot:XP_001429475.1 hypothetical protein (macronuclear) [Paramecium tetraurelia strain d4-2]